MRWGKNFLLSNRIWQQKSLLWAIAASVHSEFDPRAAWALGRKDGATIAVGELAVPR